MNPTGLKSSWRSAEVLGDSLPEYFYARLFVSNPNLRELFPASMSAQRDRLFSALGRIVSSVDDLDALAPYLRQLGADHRRFAVEPDGYPAVGRALLETLAHFLGELWTEELAADWIQAYGLIAHVMQEGAAALAGSPSVWHADVISHDRVSPGIATFKVVPHQPFAFRAGQSVPIESGLRPKVWRYLSPANSPRPDGSMEFHVRAVAGGVLSPALAYSLGPGMVVQLGAAVGSGLLLDHNSDRPLIMVAGGTGLAPLKALIDDLRITGANRPTSLIVGARTARDLYDLDALAALARQCRWLTVTPMVSDDPAYSGRRGLPTELLPTLGGVPDCEAYVCGPAEMVEAVVCALTAAGLVPQQIHTESAEVSIRREPLLEIR